MERQGQDMHRLPQDSQSMMAKLLANETAHRDIMLRHEKLREGILKSKEKYNMDALRAAGDVSAKAALEACYRKVVAENPVLLQMQDQPDSWETVWNVVFNDPRYHELKSQVDRHMDAEEKRSYGEIIADIYRKLREDVNKSADVWRKGKEVLRIVAGTLDTIEAKVLFWLLGHFFLTAEVVSDVWEVLKLDMDM
jgi:hypothetical protein